MYAIRKCEDPRTACIVYSSSLRHKHIRTKHTHKEIRAPPSASRPLWDAGAPAAVVSACLNRKTVATETARLVGHRKGTPYKREENRNERQGNSKIRKRFQHSPMSTSVTTSAWSQLPFPSPHPRPPVWQSPPLGPPQYLHTLHLHATTNKEVKNRRQSHNRAIQRLPLQSQKTSSQKNCQQHLPHLMTRSVTTPQLSHPLPPHPTFDPSALHTT